MKIRNNIHILRLTTIGWMSMIYERVHHQNKLIIKSVYNNYKLITVNPCILVQLYYFNVEDDNTFI